MEPKPSPPPPHRRAAATKRKERAASAAAQRPKRQARATDPGDLPPLPTPPPPPPNAPPRRRGAVSKRKAEEKAAFPPPERLSLEHEPVDPPPPPSEPRARKPAARRKAPRHCPVKPSRVPEEAPPPPPRPSVEQEVETVLSRGAGVHVAPTFAGWFSWKEIHPIEKQTFATFFDGKSDWRTPGIYLGIRNFIMNKFHFNPQVHVESKDLSELSLGEMDARLEILEFLAHWGLVNFHPFPPVGQECKLVESKSNADAHEKTSLAEQLFQFETLQSYLVPVSKKADVISPAQVATILSEPTLAEDAITAAESSVEYHCNSCSVDCSRKRYHCRTQADFDLCSGCYNEGKFDEGMSQADFIRMESSEAPGCDDTSWTDQETLLLLEALEIFEGAKWDDTALGIFEGAKWDDIAEHVATKTKAQCMTYFLQMPIPDSFLDGEGFNQTSQKITGHASAENITFEVSEKMEVEGNEGKESSDETSKKGSASSSETGTKLADNISGKKGTKNSGDNDLIAPSIVDELNKSSGTDPANKKTSTVVTVYEENASKFVVDSLRSAFEAVGCFSEKGDMGSFAEAGNPVMALAAFLAGLVEHDDAVTSCRSSLKAISEISPALLLATRHCFVLPDPPNDLKGPTFSVASTEDTADLGRLEGDKPSSEELPGDVSPSQGKVEPKKIEHASTASSSIQQGESNQTENGNTEEPNSNKNIAADDDSIRRLQRAGGTAIAAAAVKAKLLAEQEEHHIRLLSALVIEKQFQILEVKMSFFAEIESMVQQARAITEKIQKKLLMERNAIWMATVSSKPNRYGPPGTGLPVGYAGNQHLRRP